MQDNNTGISARVPELQVSPEKTARLRDAITRTGFWFIDIPRTSSSSIRTELGRQFGAAYGKMNLIDKSLSHEQIIRDHVPARQIRDLIGFDLWKATRTFSVVRNPWDRFLSLFFYRVRVGNISENSRFEDYVKALEQPENRKELFSYYGHHLSQHEFLSGENDRIIVDDVIAFENRTEGLQRIREELGIASLGDLHTQDVRRTYQDKAYRRFYDTTTKAIIARVYRRDIDAFGYAF